MNGEHVGEALRCRLGFHRLRWFKQPDETWEPRCSRCRRLAMWWALEQQARTR